MIKKACEACGRPFARTPTLRQARLILCKNCQINKAFGRCVGTVLRHIGKRRFANAMATLDTFIKSHPRLDSHLRRELSRWRGTVLYEYGDPRKALKLLKRGIIGLEYNPEAYASTVLLIARSQMAINEVEEAATSLRTCLDRIAGERPLPSYSLDLLLAFSKVAQELGMALPPRYKTTTQRLVRQFGIPENKRPHESWKVFITRLHDALGAANQRYNAVIFEKQVGRNMAENVAKAHQNLKRFIVTEPVAHFRKLAARQLAQMQER